MPQPTLQQLFGVSSAKASSGNVGLSETVTGSINEHKGCATTAEETTQQLQLKENTPAGRSATTADITHSRQPSSKSQDGVKVSKAAQQSKSTQLYLDLGQHDFAASRCSVCGMVYTKGHEEDEKLHKAYHQGALQGFKFQGWPQERVLVSEVGQGRLLMVLQTDPANHVKKVRELCAFVEKAHGMAAGWLLSVPQARVFLYVSSKGRVVGLAVAEPLKHAFRVLAPAGSQEQEVDSSARATQGPQQQQHQSGTPSILDAASRPEQQQQAQKRQPQQLLWPGLRKRGRLAALGRAAGAGGSILRSDPSARSESDGAPSCNLKADSCPNSLLSAGRRLQLQSPASVGAAAMVGEAAAAPAAGAGTEVGGGATVACAGGPEAPGVLIPGSHGGLPADGQEGALLALSQPLQHAPEQEQQQALPTQQAFVQQQHDLQESVLGSGASSARPMPQQRQRVPLWQRDAAAAVHSSSGPGGSVLLSADRAGSGGAGGSSEARRAGASGAAAAAGGPGGSGSGSRRSLLVDQRKPMRAMVGVRMVWVSPEQRRRGLATKLLDAARCNMVPGYVVPCNQVAFCQPTGGGVGLAAAFAGTQQFLVYGIKQ